MRVMRRRSPPPTVTRSIGASRRRNLFHRAHNVDARIYSRQSRGEINFAVYIARVVLWERVNSRVYIARVDELVAACQYLLVGRWSRPAASSDVAATTPSSDAPVSIAIPCRR